MTKSKASATGVNAQEAETKLPQPDKGQDLDAEIVRDLDADGEANEARGGVCWGTCMVTCPASGLTPTLQK